MSSSQFFWLRLSSSTTLAFASLESSSSGFPASRSLSLLVSSYSAFALLLVPPMAMQEASGSGATLGEQRVPRPYLSLCRKPTV